MPFESFGSFVGRKMRGASTRKLRAALVVAAAAEVLKARLGGIGASARIVSFKDGVLKIQGASAVGTHEISLAAPELIETINAKLKDRAVLKIIAFG